MNLKKLPGTVCSWQVVEINYAKPVLVKKEIQLLREKYSYHR